MAKKATVVDGGTVKVAFSTKYSPPNTYSSYGVDMSLELPIAPGETPEAAVDRVYGELERVFDEKAQGGFEFLDKQLKKRKTPGR